MKALLISMNTLFSLMLEEDGPDLAFCHFTVVVPSLVSRRLA